MQIHKPIILSLQLLGGGYEFSRNKNSDGGTLCSALRTTISPPTTEKMDCISTAHVLYNNKNT